MGKEKRGREDEIATSARAEKKKMQAVQRGTGYTIFDKIPFAQRFGLATPKPAEDSDEMDDKDSDSSSDEGTDDGQPATIGQIAALMKQQLGPVTKFIKRLEKRVVKIENHIEGAADEAVAASMGRAGLRLEGMQKQLEEQAKQSQKQLEEQAKQSYDMQEKLARLESSISELE